MIGLYMVVHLTVNASVLNSPATYQNYVYGIHSFGKLLPLVEWTFIFIPILFHALFGLAYIAGAIPNSGQYQYAPNYRYTLQRASALIIFGFILFHVFHMHGWFHWDAWMEHVADPFNGANFKPYNATSTASEALQGPIITAVYAIGILASVFHFANGLWTMGITWGVWTSEQAQERAFRVCAALGLALAVVGMAALFGMRDATQGEGALDQVRAEENSMYEHRVEAMEILPDGHKRWQPTSESGQRAARR